MSNYPADLIPIIEKRWKHLRRRPYGAKFPLPSKHQLEILLDVAFHATFLTEEGRRPGFRLMFYPSKDYEKDLKESPMRFGTLSSSHSRLLRFDVTRLYTVSEVNRLAPAAELTRMMICIDDISNDPKQPDLRLWSMLDVGENWWKYIHHETSGGYAPPPYLTLTSSNAGELSLSTEGEVIMTLKDGKVEYPSEDVLNSGPIGRFFEPAKRQLYKDALSSLKITKWDDEGYDEDYPKRFFGFFLERILLYVRHKQHGGAIIFIPHSIGTSDTRITDRLNIKYTCSYDYVWKLLVEKLTSEHRYYDIHFPLWDGKKVPSKELFQEYSLLSDKQQELDEVLGDVAQTIAALASVDGSVLMNDRLHVMGFGVEVTALSSSLKEVVIPARPKHIRIPIESYGTRHRAAFRFCSSFEDAVAFVVSSDGGVKATKRVGSEVFFWPDINTGAMGL